MLFLENEITAGATSHSGSLFLEKIHAMIDQAFKWIMENTPTWLIATVIAVAAFVKYGPGFFEKMVKVGEKFSHRSDTITKELLSLYKSELESEKKTNAQLAKENQELKQRLYQNKKF